MTLVPLLYELVRLVIKHRRRQHQHLRRSVDIVLLLLAWHGSAGERLVGEEGGGDDLGDEGEEGGEQVGDRQVQDEVVHPTHLQEYKDII